MARGQAWCWDATGGATRAGRAGRRVRARGEADRARRQKAARTGKWPLERLEALEPALRDRQAPRRRYAGWGGVALWPYPWLQACSPDLKLGACGKKIGNCTSQQPACGKVNLSFRYVSERLGPEGWAQARGGESAGLADLSMANDRPGVIRRAQKCLPAPRVGVGTCRGPASAPWRGCQAHRGGVTPGAKVTAQSRA